MVVGVAASQSHALAWTKAGHMYSWGDASDGKLGRGFGANGWMSVEDVGRITHLED